MTSEGRASGDQFVWALISGYAKCDTQNAFLIVCGCDEIWIPYSQCESINWVLYGDCQADEGIEAGAEIEAIRIPAWLARKLNLEIEG